MKLTLRQREALILLTEEISIPLDSNKIHKNVINSLSLKGLIRIPNYANGEFIELTDKGYESLIKK